jgi:hypothetical protein
VSCGRSCSSSADGCERRSETGARNGACVLVQRELTTEQEEERVPNNEGKLRSK